MINYNAQYDRLYSWTTWLDFETGLVKTTLAICFERDGELVKECILQGQGEDLHAARSQILLTVMDYEHLYLTCFVQDLLNGTLSEETPYPLPIWDTCRTGRQLHTDRYKWAHSAWKGAWSGYERLPQSKDGLWPRKRADRVRDALLAMGADPTKLVVVNVNDHDTEVVYDGKVVHRPTPSNARRFFEELFGHKLGLGA